MNLSDMAGKYDDLAYAALVSARADAAIVIICGGEQGNGFSIAALGMDNLKLLLKQLETILPDVLAQAKADAAKL